MKPFNYLANAVRAPEIVAILVRWGFEDLLLKLDTPQFLLRNLVRKKITDLTPYERVRNACEELGPIFVKFGQILSTRPDRLPEPLVMELKKLRSQVEPQPYKKIEPILLKDLGRSLDELFMEFDPVTVAAGSLGQVYKGQLRSNGEWVAVKVQRADIRKTISADLEIIGWFARQLHARVEELQVYNLPRLVKEAENSFEEELNYRNEADNAEIFRALNADIDNVFTPKVYAEFTTQRVLVTEWVEGTHPHRTNLELEKARELAKLGGESVFHQIVGTGFFHSDPHSGNMLITNDYRICWLDWGQAGQITLEMRYQLVDLFAAITDRDAERVIHVAEQMAANNYRVDRRKLSKEVTFLLNKYRDFGPSGTKIGTVGLEMLFIFGRNGIDVAGDYALLSKAILCVEETARTMDPDFDIVSVAKPFLSKLARERWSTQNIKRQFIYPLKTTLRHIQLLPETIQRILQRVEKEDLQINFHHTGTEKLEETFNASMNRLTVGVILGSLLIGSSLIITTGVGPLLWGFPAIGILGFLVSGILGMYIVVSILRKHN
ncbi:MAG: ubiquinone biosynthesis protein [Lentimonas sp.]|jgi:ubiquinone biosynthesis protein